MKIMQEVSAKERKVLKERILQIGMKPFAQFVGENYAGMNNRLNGNSTNKLPKYIANVYTEALAKLENDSKLLKKVQHYKIGGR